jgi:hypothetical protein
MPEPAVPAPGSPRSKLLNITASIGRTGIIRWKDVRELAESHASEDADWARFLEVLCQAHAINWENSNA